MIQKSQTVSVPTQLARFLCSAFAIRAYSFFVSILALSFSIAPWFQSPLGAEGVPLPQVQVFIDSYYAQSDIAFQDRTRPYVTQALETTDFSLNHGLIQIEGEADRFRYGLGFHTGTYVQANYALEPDSMRYIYQAWGGVKIADGLWFDMGTFPSHIGGESTLSIDNFNYTRSLVAENSPYYETGARLVWEATENLTFSLYALNGWQQIRNQNRDISVGTQVEYKLTDNWTLNYSTYIGNDAIDGAPRQTRYFQNFYAKGVILPWLETYFIYDIGFQKDLDPSWVENLDHPHNWFRSGSGGRDRFHRWEGYSIQFYFHLNERWKIGIRGEGFYDPYQIVMTTGTRNGYQIDSGSINLDYIPIENAKLRLELKHNASLDRIYRSEEGYAHNRENLGILSLAIKL